MNRREKGGNIYGKGNGKSEEVKEQSAAMSKWKGQVVEVLEDDGTSR